MKKPQPVPLWRPHVRVRFSTGEIYEFGNKLTAARWIGRRALSGLIDEMRRQEEISAGTWWLWRRATPATRALSDGSQEAYVVPVYRPSYRFFTELGDEIDPKELHRLLRDDKPWHPRSHPNKRLPGTTLWRRPYRGYRHPRTFPEHRWVAGFEADIRHLRRYGDALVINVDEYDGATTRDTGLAAWAPTAHIRGRRNPRHLVDAWDDIRRLNAQHSCWKHQRRRQWK